MAIIEGKKKDLHQVITDEKDQITSSNFYKLRRKIILKVNN